MDPRQQRSSPANDREQSPQHANSPQQQQQQMPYTFPLQQQQPQGQWTPSISAQPFYPSFYQNPQQSSPGFPQQPPYFDPSNPQLAQWAYQQMMFSAQQAIQMSPGSRNSPSSSNNDYFAQNQLGQMFNPFPSGTPPPPQQQQQQGQNGGQYPGFHPYRRPARQGSTQSQGSYNFPESSNASTNNNDWRSGIPNPPYARPDASGSSSSVNSTHSQRQRTDSNQSGRGSQGGHSTPNGSVRGRPSGGGSPVGGSSSSSNRSHSGSISSQRQMPHQQHHTHSPHSQSHSHSHSPHNNHNLPHPAPPHHRNLSASSNTSSSSGIARTSSATATSQSPSPSSTTGSGVNTPSSTSSTSTSAASSTSIPTATIPRPARPSPLSQGTSFSASEKRMSRDDADLAAMIREEAASDPRHHGRSGGLKGRLRRALTFGAQIKEEEGLGTGDDNGDDDESIKASKFGKSPLKAIPPRTIPRPSTDGTIMSDAESTNTIQTSGTTATSTTLNANTAPSIASTTAPPPKKRGRAASLFNSRLNASTDNISLSSTVSSASVMIRKLGSMGRLARRNSLAGITSLFKDKDKKKKEDIPEDDGSDTGVAASSSDGKEKDKKSKKKDKKKSTAKAQASEASVSHVTAELDRSSGSGEWNAAELAGLSPAAKLARQHTMKSNAEAAAKAQKEKEEREAAAAREAAEKANGVNGGGAGIPVWDRGTHNRSPVKGGGGVRVNEDGTRVFVEDDDDDYSEDGHGRVASSSGYGQTNNQQHHNADGWDDDDDDWDGEEEEDVTIRMGMDRVDLNAPGNAGGADWQGGEAEEDDEPWAVDVRRSVERTRVPNKGILKHTKNHAPFPLSDATNYDQHNYLADSQHPAQQHANRTRSNSYNAHSSQTEAGPLARMPSPDPDHIDGLHRHGSHSSGGHAPPSSTPTSAPSLPPLSFDSSPIKATMDTPQKPSNAPMFSHSNSSAPALSLSLNTPAPTLTHRSATAPHKRLAFANNLSVYDTFSASMYDRRSEPATWSRLTPALAQRIKEELNSYKMEEMEVHAASRIHTQFFV
ncbi:hypothetical protein VNI00_009089 [Paramarasmius palmivorus]|uniref:Protein Zds1 C-terminal domain-containing protein n=1 Tax=Paramarasmius palmivorus TaxID=297713 RepID=A0AAW0CU58_9AGAR